MSANTNGGKPAKKAKSTASRSSNGSVSFDEMRIRLFEPKREKREFNLETGVTELIDDYSEYLTEMNSGQKPSPNGVMETLAINALKGHTEFQSWREKKISARTNGNGSFKLNESDEENLLGNLDANKSKVVTNS